MSCFIVFFCCCISFFVVQQCITFSFDIETYNLRCNIVLSVFMFMIHSFFSIFIVVAQKRSGRPWKSWDEVIKNDRKKLDMDSADPQNRSEWRGRLRGRLVKKPNPR